MADNIVLLLFFQCRLRLIAMQFNSFFVVNRLQSCSKVGQIATPNHSFHALKPMSLFFKLTFLLKSDVSNCMFISI